MVEPSWGNYLENDTGNPRRRYELHSETSAAGSTTPWTSARCNRLLRPLSSKIAALRKLRQSKVVQDKLALEACHFNGSNAAEVAEDTANRHGGVPSYPTNVTGKASTYWEDEWASSPRPQKKLKRTYSSKNRTGGTGGSTPIEDHDEVRRPPREVEIGLPLGFATTLSQAIIVPPDSIKRKLQPLSTIERNAIPDIVKRTATEHSRLIDGVCKGLVALLKATSKSEPSQSVGCCSLFSTSLRQIPSYIKEEEHLSKVDDPANADDIASAVYNDLEELGSRPGAGWNPLKVVVRAHGMILVGEAIEEGAIGPADAQHISSLCLAAAADDQAQYILESLIKSEIFTNSNRPSRSRSVVNEAQMVYSSIRKFALQTGRHGFLFRKTATMLESGVLPLDWILSKSMISCWNGVIRSITQEDEHARSATMLFQTSLSRWYRQTGTTPQLEVHGIRLRSRKSSHRPGLRSVASSCASKAAVFNSNFTNFGSSQRDNTDSGLDSAMSKILTVFAAITLLEESALSLDRSDDLTSSSILLHDSGVEIRQIIEKESYNTDSQHASTLILERLRLPLLAASMSRLTHKGLMEQRGLSNSGYFASLAGLPNSSQTCASAGSFLCAVARCCATATSVDAFDFTQALVNNLAEVSKSPFDDKATRILCGKTALITAFEFAESTTQPDHLNWASEVELTLSGAVSSPSRPVFTETPARGIVQRKKGYRWEEGICEWIAKTPALVLRGPGNWGLNTSQNDSAAETPVAKSKQQMPLLSELTPCAINKKVARPNGQSLESEVRSPKPHVKAQFVKCGDRQGREELTKPSYICKSPQKKMSKLIQCRKTYTDHLDDEVDELCTQDSSQENPSTVPAVRGFSNMPCGIKRKKLAGSSRPYHCDSHKMQPVATHRFGMEDNSDMEDELAFS